MHWTNDKVPPFHTIALSGNKKYYCLNVQGVCDSNYLFRAITIRHVGTTNDGTAFKQRSLKDLATTIPFPFHYIGDNAYTDSSHIMISFEGLNLYITDPPKEWFNFGSVNWELLLNDVLK